MRPEEYLMLSDPAAGADAVRSADAAHLPNPPRFTPEESSIEIDDDDDPADPLTPGDFWY